MTRHFFVAAALVWGFATVGALRPADAQDTYNLKRTFKAGEIDRYKTTMDIEAASGMKLQITFTTTEKTEEIKEDGSMVRSITVETGELSVGGQTMAMPGFQRATMKATFDKDGKVVKEEGQGGQFRQMLSMTRPMVEAGRPLKIGEEWKTQLPTNQDGTKKLDVTVTLVALEPKSDKVPVDSYKVKTVAEGPIETPQGDAKVRMEAVTLTARENGKLVRSEGTITGLTLPQFGEAKISFKVETQPEEKKETVPSK